MIVKFEIVKRFNEEHCIEYFEIINDCDYVNHNEGPFETIEKAKQQILLIKENREDLKKRSLVVSSETIILD